MILFYSLSLALLVGLDAHVPHVPHDAVHGVATGVMKDGSLVTVIAASRECRVMYTQDMGLSWTPVSGDGLERAWADKVVFHPGSRKFIIGTNEGVWSFDSTLGEVKKMSQGLPGSHGLFVAKLASPFLGSDGPVILANRLGQVWEYDFNQESWIILLDSGHLGEQFGQVAIAPNYQSLGGPTSRSMAAAFSGVLFLSEDGGNTWSVCQQFSTPSVSEEDPVITAISFAHDYAVTGCLVMATSIPNLANATKDEGTIWQSTDYGGGFTARATILSSIRALVSTPIGPFGESWFLAAPLGHPDLNEMATSQGIFRSSDAGVTWDDFGSAQDFIAEKDSSDTIGLGRAKVIDFSVSPVFSSDGSIFFSRSEGFYLSANEGLQWGRVPVRPETQLRSLKSIEGPDGNLLVVAGTYGSGTAIYDISDGGIRFIQDSPINYQEMAAISPQYAEDNVLIAVGSEGLAFWFNPDSDIPNIFQQSGWKLILQQQHLGYIRSIAFSPHFNALGTPISDQTFFMSSSTGGNWSNLRSTDGGLTAEPLTRMVNGGRAPTLRNLVVAPTYQEDVAGGRRDVYGINHRGLFGLDDSQWELVLELPSKIKGLALDPGFDRDPMTPALPRIFIAIRDAPFFIEYVDDPFAPSYREYSAGLDQVSIESIVCAPDFETNPVVYAATFSSGVKRLDLSQSTPVWEEVGSQFPNVSLDSIEISPNFATDHLLFVGSQGGLVVGKDLPGFPWVLKEMRLIRDNKAPAFHYFSPFDPRNPHPERIWPWNSIVTEVVRQRTDVSLVDADVEMTLVNGAYIEVEDSLNGIDIHTFSGPTCGEMFLEVLNLNTGHLVANLRTDLSSPTFSNAKLSLAFSQQPVKVRITANLTQGERMFFDAATFYRE